MKTLYWFYSIAFFFITACSFIGAIHAAVTGGDGKTITVFAVTFVFCAGITCFLVLNVEKFDI